jgi:glycosyltransferase involved in cell wall biosynthesis
MDPVQDNWPKITIVTPSYNQGDYLEETIRSVLLQKYPNLEYLIIDGGSSDDSKKIIEKYSNYLAYYCVEKDDGQSDAINKGFARATGEVFGYLNSDDVYKFDSLYKIAADYLADERPKEFWRAYAVEDFEGDEIRAVIRPRLNTSLRDWLLGGANLHQPGVFWSRQIHESVGGFDRTLQYAFDRKFFVAALLKGYRFKVDREFVTTRFRYHQTSKTVSVGAGGGFSDEVNATCTWVRSQMSWAQRFRYLVDGLYGRDLYAAEEAIVQAFRSTDRFDCVRSIAHAVACSPSITGSRLFWGGLRHVFKGRREST